MSPINYEWLTVSLGLTALILFVEHWIPTGPKRLHCIFNYVLGVSAILVGVTLYFFKTGRGLTAVEVWLFAIVGGMAVIFAYGWDWLMNRLAKDNEESKHVETPSPHG